MKVLCLAGAGKICLEVAHDLVQFSDFQNITIDHRHLSIRADAA